MKKYHYIIEGCDRLGKDTIITNIQRKLGPHQVIHYSKPLKSEVLGNNLFQYQYISFEQGFNLLDNIYPTDVPLIFNRFHLGEVVYAKRYRGYQGDYVFPLEVFHSADEMLHVKLILLTTSNWNLITDDGESHDFSQRQEEQEDFIKAFNKSIFPNKRIIDIANGNSWKSPEQILEEVIGD
jgi:thymidylate kinase